MLIVVIVFGIASRSPALPLSRFLTSYVGDATWALAFFLGIGLLLPDLHTRYVGMMALVISFAVELSQLYHAPWIDAIRSSTIGHLALGSGFDAIDLLWYIAGVGIGALGEVGIFRFAGKESSVRTLLRRRPAEYFQFGSPIRRRRLVDEIERFLDQNLSRHLPERSA
jgi:hypothetical protein